MKSLLQTILIVALLANLARCAQTGLVGHWTLQGDCRDHSGHDNHGVNHGVDLKTGQFDGVQAFIEIPASESLRLGTGDFTISAHIYTAEGVNDVIGDVLEKYDPATRRGLTLSINSTAGGFQSQGDDRHVYFGIDNAHTSEWNDCGRPSETSNYVSESMTVYQGKLYAATTGGKTEADWRHVYRYDGGRNWTDCGQVGEGHAQGVGPMIVHGGNLYAVTWTVDWTRVAKGGYGPARVYRYLGGTKWEDCGEPGSNPTLNCMASYRGKLYVGGGPNEYGVYVEDGVKTWKPSKLFEMAGPRRCFPHSMAVFNGKLFTGYPVAYAFDGQQWNYVGQPFDYDNSRLQLYCFAAHQGKLCVGSWPEGKVAVYQGGEKWREIGRVGEDGTEVNGLVVYNGKLYGGSLPRAEVCRYDGDDKWTSLKRFYSPEGWKPGIPYQASRAEVNEWVRLTSLTVYDGKLFASTGSCTSSVDDAPLDRRGEVFSMEAGKCASYDADMGPGWKHLVARRQGGRLNLFIDGKLVAQSSEFAPQEYDLSVDRPLRIGFGQTDYFAGRIQDVRLYNRSLTEAEIRGLTAGSKRAFTASKSPVGRIVTAPTATRIDRFAAAELKRYMHQSLGWSLQLAGDAETNVEGPTFFVGSLDSGVAEAAGFPDLPKETLQSLGDEGILIQGNDQAVVLAGKGERGGLNAVYDFLRADVGCRWPEPGREYVPKRESLGLNISRDRRPAFAYRGVALHGPCTTDQYLNIIDWLAKNHANTLQFSCEVYDNVRPALIDAIRDRGLSMKIGGHSRQYFFSSQKNFGTHPDYFALVKGQRTGATQLCYSNHESVASYADNIIQYLQARPEIGIVGLWPSDGYGFCECDKCRSRPTTDLLLDYTNALAKRVHDRLPNVEMEFLSYIHYTKPPAVSRPLDYVLPIYCEYWSRNQFHPITDDRSDNKRCRRQLAQWAKLSNKTTVYGYYADDTIKRFLYNPVSDVVMADLAYYKSIGVDGSSVLMMYPQSWWSCGPHLYAYVRASWDGGSTLDQISQEYLKSLYGDPADSINRHEQAARALFDETFGHGETGEEMLFNFRIKKFDPEREADAKRCVNLAVKRIRNSLAEAKSKNSDAWVQARLEILDEDAQLMEIIYNLLSESAGYKLDHLESRKARMHDLMKRFQVNRVIKQDDYRCKIQSSLMPQVAAVLGAEDAAKYERRPVIPLE